MIKSMTGYGRAQEIVDGREITVEIRSVNHRFFEFSSRVPRAYAYLEEKLKSLLQGAIARGKVEAAVTVVTLEGESSDVQINHALAAQYLAALRGMGQDLGIQDDVTVSTIARFGDIFVVRRGQEDMDQVWEGVRQVAEKALEGFLSMREVEGRRLREDLENRLAAMEELVSRVEEQSWARRESMSSGFWPRRPSLPTTSPWTRRRCGCAATSRASGRLWTPARPWAASWISWSRR